MGIFITTSNCDYALEIWKFNENMEIQITDAR